MRNLLPVLVLLLAACGQTSFNPFPPCFPFCGGSGGGGGGGSREPPPEVRSLEVVLLQEVVEASPGASGGYVSLPLRVRLEGDPGSFFVYLYVLLDTPEGKLSPGWKTVETRSGEEREEEVPIWVGPGWPPGDYQARLEATASGYSGGPLSRPFTLRVY